MIKLTLAISLLVAALVALLYTTFNMIGYFPGGLLYSQLFTMLGPYVLLGIGAGIPIALLAAVMGWLQLVLLVSGNIDPHLAKESFVGVLKTLFSKL